jgi:hypothetical protein
MSKEDRTSAYEEKLGTPPKAEKPTGEQGLKESGEKGEFKKYGFKARTGTKPESTSRRSVRH